jgi:hypothetical protein
MSRDGEGQANRHPRGVAFHGCIDVAFDPAEVYDLVQLAVYFPLSHSEDRTIQVNVLASGEFRVKAGANFQQTGDTSSDLNIAGSRRGDARQQLKQSALAGPVATDDPNGVALTDLKIDVLQTPYNITFAFLIAVVLFAKLNEWVISSEDSGNKPSFEIPTYCPGPDLPDLVSL